MNASPTLPLELQGLTEKQAQEKLLKFGANELPSKSKKGFLKILLRIVLEPSIAILFLCTVIYFSIGTFTEACFLGATVCVIVTVTIFQEKKTENSLEQLKDLSSPRTLVLRDGKMQRISSKNLVPGDVINLHEGDRVSADGQLFSINNFSVDESMITGESVPVEKKVQDLIMSGSLVVRGDAMAVVTATGVKSTIGKIGKSLADISTEPTLLQKKMTKLGRSLSILAFFVCSLVFFLSLKTGRSWQEGFLSSLATAIAMMPEEFPVVLIIYLALGAWRLSKISVLARKTNAIENLGAVTVLCVDKTGTLTLNEMSIEKVSGVENNVVEAAYLASELHPSDPMEKAIIKKMQNLQLPVNPGNLIQSLSVSKEVLAYRALYQNHTSYAAYAKGAPETIAHFCSLAGADKKKMVDELSMLTRAGYRVLGVAKKSLSESTNWDQHTGWEWLGLLAFLDPIRPEVPEAVQKCLEAGIQVKMLTGDHPETAKTIAQMVGIKNHEVVITGSELAALSFFELKEKVNTINVFARVKPEQKLSLVNMLKEKGHHVAMTGDGVNDAPGLKASDVGVAMGKRGADVAREAADIVLLDDNFASLVNAITEGRRIYSNIQKSFSFLMGVHIMIGLLSFLPLVLGLPLLFYPLHFVLIEFVVDPASSLVFDKELPGDQLMKVAPRSINEPIFPQKKFISLFLRGLLMTALVLTVFAFMLSKGVSTEQSRLWAFLILNWCMFYFLFKEIKSKPARLWGTGILVFAMVIFVLIIFIPVLSDIFKMGIS